MFSRLRKHSLPVVIGVWAGLIGAGSFARILTPFGFSISLLDIGSLLLLALLGIPRVKGIQSPWVGFFLYLIVGFVISAYSYSIATNSMGALYLLRLIVYAMLAVQIGVLERSLLRKSFFIALFIITITSIGQYLFLPSLKDLEYLGWDEHAGRLFGGFFDAHIAGIMYGLSAIGLYLLGKEGKKSNGIKNSEERMKGIGYGIGTSLAILALVMSLSRLALASMGAATVVSGKGSMRKAFLIGFFVAGTLLVVRYHPTRIGSEATHLLRTSTVSARFVDNQNGIALGLQYPLVGVGYNRLPSYKKSQESPKQFEVLEQHASGAYPSVFVTIFATGGVIGLLLFLRLCWWVWTISNADQRVILSFVYVASLFESTLLIPIIISYTALLWWMVGEVKNEKS